MVRNIGEISILGQTWTVKECTKMSDDKLFSKGECSGYSSYSSREIMVLALDSDYYLEGDFGCPENDRKRVLRHEIVHSFLSESGLQASAGAYSGSWAENEAMVDWIAIQLPKIVEACKAAGCM